MREGTRRQRAFVIILAQNELPSFALNKRLLWDLPVQR